MAGSDSGDDTSDDQNDRSNDDVHDAGAHPPPGISERRGSTAAVGGRRAADHRASADDGPGGASKDDTKKNGDEKAASKADDADGEKSDKKKDGDEKDGKDDDEDKPKPPTHDPERRGSMRDKGGRRATDQRGGDDEEGDDDKDDDDKDDDKKDKPSPLKKTWVRILIAVVVILLLIALVWWLIYYFTHGRYIQNTNDAYVKADKVLVTATVAAKVERIAVLDNQVVKRGDLLIVLDQRSNNARLLQYDALATQARAQAEQYRMQIVAQEATIAQYAAQARGAEVQRDYYSGEAKRYAPLVAAGAEKEETLAQYLQNRDKSAQDVRQYRESETAARRQVDVLKTQVAQAEAQVAQAAAQRAQTEVDVGNSVVRASVDGRVGDRQVFPGTYVNPGSQMLTIVPIDAIYVEANFKETQIGLMRIGQPVTISVDALDGTKVSGTVESFQPATGSEFSVLPAQNATGNFTKIVQRIPVRIHLDAGPEARKVLIPGLSVVVDVDTVGDKRDVDRREKEEDRREDRTKDAQQRETDFERDHREPGAGR